MKLGVLKEPSGENRVSIIPASVKKLIKTGFDVIVESGAGILSYHVDEEYQTAGAKISDRTTVLSSDIIISISPPNLSGNTIGAIPLFVEIDFLASPKFENS